MKEDKEVKLGAITIFFGIDYFYGKFVKFCELYLLYVQTKTFFFF